MSNTDEELDAELLKLSVPDPTVAPARKELEAEQPEINHEDVSPQVTETAKATTEPAKGVIGKPSDAVLNFHKSFMLWTEEEKQQMFHQVVTPSTGWRTPVTVSVSENTYQQQHTTLFNHNQHPMSRITTTQSSRITRHLIRVELI